MPNSTYLLHPFQEEFLTPEKFLGLTEEERDNILESDFRVPYLGAPRESGFGHIRVVWKDPKYRIRF